MRLATWLALVAVVLSPIGFMMTHDRIGNRKIVQALSDLDFLRRAIKLSVDERHRLPSEAEGLPSLAEGGAPLLDTVPDDLWQHPDVYRRSADAPGFVLYATGADGVDDHGASDDITTPDKS